jgi:hypothetical protein
MDKDAEIEALLEEAANAKAWFVKLGNDLKSDPANDGLLRLRDICRQEFDKRWDRLEALGLLAGAARATRHRPKIDDIDEPDKTEASTESQRT